MLADHSNTNCELIFGKYDKIIIQAFKKFKILLEMSLPGLFPKNDVFNNILSIVYKIKNYNNLNRHIVHN